MPIDRHTPTAARRALLDRIVCCAAIVASTCVGAAARADCSPAASAGGSPAAPTPAAHYALVKNWDFCHLIRTNEQLQSEFFTRYIYKNGTLDFLNDEWQRYRDSRNHVFGPDGLSLVARLTDKGMQRGAIESGMLRSRWTGEFGYYEARVRVPRARGAWPAFWLNPQDMTWPPEIDIFEIVDNGRDTSARSFHFLHGGAKAAPQPEPSFTLMGRNKFYEPAFNYADGFHTFAVMWTPGEVTHYVDGVRIKQTPFSWTHAGGADAGPAHVLLNLAVGGHWPGAPVAEADFPMKLDVEFIRVWQAPAGLRDAAAASGVARESAQP